MVSRFIVSSSRRLLIWDTKSLRLDCSEYRTLAASSPVMTKSVLPLPVFFFLSVFSSAGASLVLSSSRLSFPRLPFSCLSFSRPPYSQAVRAVSRDQSSNSSLSLVKYKSSPSKDISAGLSFISACTQARKRSPYFSYLNSPTPETFSISPFVTGFTMHICVSVLSEKTI